MSWEAQAAICVGKTHILARAQSMNRLQSDLTPPIVRTALLLVFCTLAGCFGGSGSKTTGPPSSTRNLMVDWVSHSPCSVERGLTIDVTDVVRNTGNTKVAATFRVGIYLSDDSAISTSDQLLGVRYVSGLGSGKSSSGLGTMTIPANTTPGTYYVGAIVDDENRVEEVDEQNNAARSSSCSDGRLEVTDPGTPQPDLVVLATSHSPCTVERGDSISVSDTVMNQGTANTTASFRVAIYLSTDNIITPGADVLLGYRIVSSLAQGATSTGSSTLTIPTSVSARNYFIGAFADYQGSVTELVESNNSLISTSCGNGSLTVTEPPNGPDLVFSALSHSPCTIENGQQVSISTTVLNAGGQAAGNFRIGLYLSSDSTVTTSDTLIGYWSVSGVSAGGSYSQSAPFTVNTNTGTYYLGGIVDYLNQVAESGAGESNNDSLSSTCSNKLIVTDPPVDKPDLEPVSTTHNPCSVTAGSSISVSSQIKNNGPGHAGSFEVGIYLSSNSTITTGDDRIGTYTVGSLSIGATNSETGSYPVPTNLNGTYFVGVIADWNDQVVEENENNNELLSSSCGNGSLLVNPPQADLEPVSVTHSPCTVNAGSSISVTSQIRNNGPGSAGSFEVGIYLSTNTTISTSDPRIGAYSISSLSSGGTRTTTGTYATPAGFNGTYYVGCIADWNAQLSEGNEGNNDLRSSSCSNGSVDINGAREAYLSPVQDMVVASGLPSTNFCGTIWDNYLGLGNDNYCIWASPAGDIWTYIQFDVSNSALLAAGVPSAYLNNLSGADLILKKMQDCSAPYGSAVKLEANSSSWSECSINWNNQPIGGGPHYNTVLSNGSTVAWPLKSPGIWDYWRNSRNHGLVIIMPTVPSGLWVVGSRSNGTSSFRPQLKLTW